MNVYSYAPFTIALLLITLSIGVLVGRKAEFKYFALLAFLSGMWQISWVVLFNIKNIFVAKKIAIIGHIPILLIPMSIVNLARYYYSCYSKKSTYFHFLVLTILFSLLFFTDLIISGVRQHFFGYYPVAGKFHVLFLSYIFLSMAELITVFKYKKNQIQEFKLSDKMFISGILMYSLSAIDFITNYGFKIYPFGFVFLILFIACIFISTLLRLDSLTRIGDLAAQVAHDIRSPVTVLKVVSETLKDIDPKKKQLIEKAATRINGIADNLVSEYRAQLTTDLALKSVQRPASVNEVIQEIVDEKKIILKNNAQIFFNSAEPINFPDYLNIIEFKRVLSNLINNSIEAFDKAENKITISLFKNEQFVYVTIKDNGRGIPSEVLSQLFQKGVSFSKKQGTGLGLAHAKNYLESIKGSVEIESEFGVGTEIEIKLKYLLS